MMSIFVTFPGRQEKHSRYIYLGLSKLSGHNYIDVKDFIVKRQQVESKLKDTLERTGSIAVVESSQKMGKTTLIHQVLESINCDNYEVIQLNVKLLLNPDYETFLRSFCSIVAKHLNLENKLDDYWSDGIAPNYNVTDYFEKYLLGCQSILRFETDRTLVTSSR